MSVGTFNFFDGMPDAATVKSSLEHLKFIRAYETFLTLMPASIEMLRVAMRRSVWIVTKGEFDVTGMNSNHSF